MYCNKTTLHPDAGSRPMRAGDVEGDAGRVRRAAARVTVWHCVTVLYDHCTPVCPHQRGRVRRVLRQVSGPVTV